MSEFLQSIRNPNSEFRFSTALLAGGKSSRMGQDKATVEFEGEPLWQRQIRLLKSLGPSEILISGRPDGPYVGSSYKIIYDHEEGQGPLAGLAALLEACATSHLLVLAVDMPWMTRTALDQIVALGNPDAGVVPEHEGWYEGTAALYPASLLPLVNETLHGNDRSFQFLIRKALDKKLLQIWPLPSEVIPSFRSWNAR
jgi:molybdopterin-guanine dinucleotide biosynthesis protein A